MDTRSNNVDTKRQTTKGRVIPRFLLLAALFLPALSVTAMTGAAPGGRWASVDTQVVKSATVADTLGTSDTIDVNPTTSDVNWSS